MTKEMIMAAFGILLTILNSLIGLEKLESFAMESENMDIAFIEIDAGNSVQDNMEFGVEFKGLFSHQV